MGETRYLERLRSASLKRRLAAAHVASPVGVATLLRTGEVVNTALGLYLACCKIRLSEAEAASHFAT